MADQATAAAAGTVANTVAPRVDATVAVPFAGVAREPRSARCLRWSALPLFALALGCTVLAVVSRLTHTYPHPLQAAGLLGDGGDVSAYRSEQTCEMSYFFLSHVERPITRLSTISRDLLEGRLRFGMTPALVQESAARREKRRTAEFDDDEEEIAADDELPLTPTATTPAVDSPDQASLEADFASFARLFLGALPQSLSPQASSRYKLYQFVHSDQTGRNEAYQRDPASRHTPAHNLLPRVPVLFIHGNGGSYHQMRSLASRLATAYIEERDASARANPGAHPPAHLPDLNDYYTVDMFEESGAFNGRLLWRQAWFINEAIGQILSGYPDDTRLVLVGHSMGGVVARALWSLGNFPRTASGAGRVAMVATLGTPHRAPVVQTDEAMKRLYRAVNDPTRAYSTHDEKGAPSSPFSHLYPLVSVNSSVQSEQPFFVSVSGGERDFQIEPALADIDGIFSPSHAISVASHSIHHAPLSESGNDGASVTKALGSVDHQCLCWCRQLMETLAFSIRDLTRNLLAKRLHQPEHGVNETIERQKAFWLPAALPALRDLVSNSPPASTAAARQQAPATEWEVYDDEFTVASSMAVRLDSSKVEDGLVSVWTGLMNSVALCVNLTTESKPVCTDLTTRVRLLAPHMHPEHAVMSHEARLAKRVGLVSTYLLHITAADLAALNFPSEHIELRLTPEESTLAILRKLRPLRGGAKRLFVYGMSYRVSQLALGGETLANRGAAYQWTRHIPAGMDTHLDMLVDARAEADHEYPLPSVVTLFSASTSSPTDQKLNFPPASYSDQLFTFFPRSSTQKRSIHVYRSGVDRQLVGLILRFPQRLGLASTSEQTVSVTFHEHEFVSFMHTLYLQFPLLPQLLLGSALILFGVQHEYLRKHGAFPRLYELLVLPSSFKPAEWLASSFVWGLGVLIVGFHVLFRGSLVGDPAARVTDVSQTNLWTGWSLSTSSDWSLGWIGLILFFSCIALHVILEIVVHNLLWGGSKVIRLVWFVVSRPFRSLTTPTAPDATTAPQQRYLTTLCRRTAMVAWIGFFFLASVFTSSLSLFALKYLGNIGLIDQLFYIGQQAVAWVSTLLMIFGLISEHVYFQKDVVDWFVAYATFDSEVAIGMLILGMATLTLILQMATFPTIANEPTSEWKRRGIASSAAYKSSLVTMMLLVAAILLAPQLLSCFRLDVSAIEAAWARNPSNLLFTAPGASKVYDQSMVSPFASLPAGVDTAPSIFVYPFVVTSPFDPLSVVALAWVTMASWCAFHVPFSPPILQSACITTYGLALVFVHGPAVAFLNFWWIALMLCLCMVPHALASGLYILHLLWDFGEGQEGAYDRMYEHETSLHHPKRQAPPQTQAMSSGRAPSPTQTKPRENKKHK